MINLKSKTLTNYYGNNPDEYNIKFIHHNIDVATDTNEEYYKLEDDLKNIYEKEK